MTRTLKKLSKILYKIEAANEWEFNFVQGLVVEMEEGRDFKAKPLSDAQQIKLVQIDTKYRI